MQPRKQKPTVNKLTLAKKQLPAKHLSAVFAGRGY